MVVRTQRTAVEAISIWGSFILGIGTILLFASIGFLSCFWQESQAVRGNSKPSSSFWNALVLGGWATRAVTITSIFIRIAIGLQSGLMTAMLASMVIETRGVHLPQLPALSIMRSVSSGAHNLVEPLLCSPWSLGQLGYVALALLVAATSFASNFTSTLLLADFGVVDVPARVKTDKVPTAIITSYGTIGTNYWASQPNKFPRFAELAGDAQLAEGLQDTGPSLRAFLPFSAASDRQSLKQFDGPSPVFNSQVTCVRPSLKNLTMTYTQGINIFLSGRFTGFDIPYDKDLPPSVTQNFNCTIVQGLNGADHYGVKSLCFTQFQDREGDGPTSYRSLVVSMSDGEYWEPWPLKDFVQSPDGVWNTWTSQDKTQTLRATTCHNFADEPQLKYTSIRASQQYKEPEIEFDQRTGKPKTNDIISLYCTHCETSARQAGRMDLKLPPREVQLEEEAYLPVYAALRSEIYLRRLWRGFPMMPHSAYAIDQVYSEIFWGIINQTENAAFAVQTLFTLLTQATYYSALPRFNTYSSCERQSWETHLLPTQMSGLIVVIVLMGVHLVLAFLVTVLFIRMTRYSFLLNAWPVITQLYSAHVMEDIVKQSPSMTDKQLQAQFKRCQLHKATYRVTLGQSELQHDAVDSVEATRDRLHRI
ncbi:hypothetical protein CDD81_2667 [Ophiocordyceps australis]|uniref:Uncharacterized protein n=1 Tax=Ophiocordyceps australis TaxID=1399860 RepID=A0A2C5XQY9_9HYPO|nr:hypothetical protein CDD81_2667 [Ophiocordyceps australis]